MKNCVELSIGGVLSQSKFPSHTSVVEVVLTFLLATSLLSTLTSRCISLKQVSLAEHCHAMFALIKMPAVDFRSPGH